MTMHALGVFREILHSPERESDDAAILRLVGEALAREGITVSLKPPEEVLRERQKFERSLPQLIFAMCEQENILQLLKQWKSDQTVIINSPDSIFNTYRYKMVPILQASRIPMPQSELLPVSDGQFLSAPPAHPARENGPAKQAAPHSRPIGKIWVKRGDVHNTQKGDVVLVETDEEIQRSFNSFRLRGVKQALLQQHMDGDLIKFYGTAAAGGDPAIPRGETASRALSSYEIGTGWFKWFYHKDQNLKRYKFSKTTLKQMTHAAAGYLGLEIFGGDAIVTASGEIFLIDMNAWPSFALFRAEAAKVIGQYLLSRLSGRVASL